MFIEVIKCNSPLKKYFNLNLVALNVESNIIQVRKKYLLARTAVSFGALQ